MGPGIDPETGRWDWSIGRIAWVDIETTGTWDPVSPPLMLEACTIVTDRDLNELGRYSAVVDYKDLSYLTAASPFVVDMHAKSGLWKDLEDRKNARTIAEIESELCALLSSTAILPGGDLDTRPVVWAGFSPSALDRPMVRRLMPAFNSMIHYRTIDVSSEKLTALNYFGITLGRSDPGHRAEQDTEDTIEAFARITRLIEKKTRRRAKSQPFPARSK